MDERLIAEFPWPAKRNPGETCRVVIREYEGKSAVAVYGLYRGRDGEWKAGNGIVLRANEVPLLRAALELAEAELR